MAIFFGQFFTWSATDRRDLAELSPRHFGTTAPAQASFRAKANASGDQPE